MEIHSDITWFPLIQLPRKSEENKFTSNNERIEIGFPLIQLPRKSEDFLNATKKKLPRRRVSINSTSEEVRSGIGSPGSYHVVTSFH